MRAAARPRICLHNETGRGRPARQQAHPHLITADADLSKIGAAAAQRPRGAPQGFSRPRKQADTAPPLLDRTRNAHLLATACAGPLSSQVVTESMRGKHARKSMCWSLNAGNAQDGPTCDGDKYTVPMHKHNLIFSRVGHPFAVHCHALLAAATTLRADFSTELGAPIQNLRSQNCGTDGPCRLHRAPLHSRGFSKGTRHAGRHDAQRSGMQERAAPKRRPAAPKRRCSSA